MKGGKREIQRYREKDKKEKGTLKGHHNIRRRPRRRRRDTSQLSSFYFGMKNC